MIVCISILALLLSCSVAQTSEVLTLHNAFRSQHGANALVWNSSIAIMAQNWASRCLFQHDVNNMFGENLYGRWGGSRFPLNNTDLFTMSTHSWYNEAKYYNYAKPGYTQATGHFTQVVWKNTKQLGCAIAPCSGDFTFVVCKYSPPGNLIGLFKENVSPPIR